MKQLCLSYVITLETVTADSSWCTCPAEPKDEVDKSGPPVLLLPGLVTRVQVAAPIILTLLPDAPSFLSLPLLQEMFCMMVQTLNTLESRNEFFFN